MLCIVYLLYYVNKHQEKKKKKIVRSAKNFSKIIKKWSKIVH